MACHDVPMEMCVEPYRRLSPSPLFQPTRGEVMIALKVMAHEYMGLVKEKSTTLLSLPDNFRDDWLREAAMACIELGIGLRFANILRLLEDRDYFESLLPLPIDDPGWAGTSGTELVRQWWLYADEKYRAYHLRIFQRLLSGVDEAQLRRLLVYHPEAAHNRGFAPGDPSLSGDVYEKLG